MVINYKKFQRADLSCVDAEVSYDGNIVRNTDSSGVYTCKSIVNYLRHGNYICKSEGNYLVDGTGYLGATWVTIFGSFTPYTYFLILSQVWVQVWGLPAVQ